jgi:hypothetical protein
VDNDFGVDGCGESKEDLFYDVCGHGGKDLVERGHEAYVGHYSLAVSSGS